MKTLKRIAPAVLLVISHGLIGQDNMVYRQIEVNASAAEAWNKWTTKEGLETFIAPKANVEMKLGGLYEVFFFPLKPYGEQGTDYSRVLSLIPGKMLSVEWGVPRWFEARAGSDTLWRRTYIVLEFSDKANGSGSILDFYHLGFEEGKDWDHVFEYFDEVWDGVLDNFKLVSDTGVPIDWETKEWTKAR